MSEALTNPSTHLRLAIMQARAGGDILLRDHSERTADEIGVRSKADKSGVTETDIEASNTIIAGIDAAVDEKTITEEVDDVPPELQSCLGEYTDDPVWIIDPTDGTNNYIKAILSNPDLDRMAAPRQTSVAMVSVARLAGGRPITGALLATLLGVPPILYAAEEGAGAIAEHEGVRTKLEVDPNVETGIVLVSENNHPYIPRLQEMGFATIGIGGFVFKLCCVLDPELITLFADQLEPEERELALQLPVVGLASPSSALYDHAAGVVVAREAGAFVRTPQGATEIAIAPGKHGLVVARNAHIGSMIVSAMNDSSRS